MSRQIRLLAIATSVVVGILASSSVQASDEPSRFKIDGFGTLGLVHSSEDRADFMGGLLRDHGAGHTQGVSPDVDSRLGLQLSASFSAKWSAVVQVVAEQNYDGTFNPHLEWANVSYQLTPDARVRVGRTLLASFMLSDSRKVGYATPWVRPPVEVYGLVPITTRDGIDVSYRVDHGSLVTTIEAGYGENTNRLPAGGSIYAKESWGVGVTAEQADWTVRVAYEQTNLTIDSFNELFDGFRRFGPEGVAIADRYDAAGTVLRFGSVGTRYDSGAWFLMGEWGRVQSGTAVGDRSAWYLSAGYHLGALTPYATYSTTTVTSPISDPGLNLANYPPQVVAIAVQLNGTLNAILGTSPVQETVSLGARWDFARNLALKVQLDRSNVGAGSPGVLGNLQPGFETGGRYRLVSLVVDFLF